MDSPSPSSDPLTIGRRQFNSRLMGGLKKADVRLNRKMLAQLAVVDPGSFTNVVATAKS